MKNKIYTNSRIARLNEGSRDAFCELYVLYKDRVMCYAVRFLKSKELAEDVCQEAFLSIWQKTPELEDEDAFSKYLYTIVRNRIFNIYRDQAYEQSLKESIFSYAIDVSNETEDLLEERELGTLFEEVLRKLPSRNRKIFRMSREEMLSYKEIAEKLGLSVSSVQKYMSDSLGVIREFLAEYAGISSMSLLFLILAG